MDHEDALRRVPPADLSAARAIAHKAVQLLTCAARANLPSEPDDSHSNLGWDSAGGRFLSQPLPSSAGPVFVGLSLSPLRLDIVVNGEDGATLELDGQTWAHAFAWLDERLAKLGLSPATQVELPYELPEDAAAIASFDTARVSRQLTALSAWYDLAATVLERFTRTISALEPGPVRCWPHHFDIATYVQLEAGDFETARGIGVGLSPGDESYGQPYAYINPWPHLDPAGLPDAPSPGHWHVDGFVGAIATGDELLTGNNVAADLAEFVASSFAIGRAKLEC